jgi:hypothetical protein
MEDFANRFGSIAVLLEVLRQSRVVADEGSPVMLKVISEQRVGSSRSQHRVATRRTKSLVGVDTRERKTPPSEHIHVWSLRSLIAELSDSHPKVIEHDEQDVWPRVLATDRREQHHKDRKIPLQHRHRPSPLSDLTKLKGRGEGGKKSKASKNQ